MEQIGTFPISPEASAQLDNAKSALSNSQSSNMMSRMMSHMSWPVVTAAAAALAGGAAFWWYRKSH